MKILAAILGAALLLSPLSVRAETKIPEEFLMTSLGKITICIRAQSIGLSKLVGLSKQMQKDEPRDMAEDNKKTLDKMLSGVDDLQQIVVAEKIMGRVIITELMQEYSHTLEDLNQSMKPIVEMTDKSMVELLKDVSDFNDFNQVFVPKMNFCATAIEDIVKESEKIQKGLESKN